MGNSLINPHRTDFLKLLACVSMLIDHIGAILGPALFAGETVSIMRAVGRLAFPIFAYHIALGFVKTRSAKKYFLRLFIFALAAQYPFTLAFRSGLNVMFTLLLAFAAIWLFEMARGSGLHPPFISCGIGLSGVALIALISQYMDCDYGAFGVLIVFIFYLFRDSHGVCAAAQLILLAGYMLLLNASSVRWFMLFGHALIFIQVFGARYPEIKSGKYFFYAFYPAHLLALSFIRTAL